MSTEDAVKELNSLLNRRDKLLNDIYNLDIGYPLSIDTNNTYLNMFYDTEVIKSIRAGMLKILRDYLDNLDKLIDSYVISKKI